MFFFGVTAALLLTSALIGYGVFVAAYRLRRRWVTAIIGIGCAFVLLIAAAIVYLTIGDTPANNERVGSERRFDVWIRAKGVEPLVKLVPPTTDSRRRETIPSPSRVPDFFNEPSNKPTPLPVIGRIEVRAPTSVTPRQDFSLALSISYDLQLPSDAQVARLSAPRSAEVRTLDVCATEPERPLSACSTPVGNRFQIAWDVTPTEPGQLLFTIGIPPSLTPQSRVDEWEAVAVGPWGSGGHGESPIMSPSSPAVTWLGMSTDMLSGQLRVPVEVVETLGVTRGVYNALALMGTLLSALLGSGWLWKLLEWWRTRSISTRSSAVGNIVG